MRKEEGLWLGSEREAALHSPSTPRNTCLPPPPQHQTKGEAPSPRGYSHPNLGCTFSGFQQSYGSGGHGWGGSPSVSESQLDSGSDPGLSVHPGTHSLCHLFF